jgi:2-iminobutanoate/2-iminopropanoate deaminase
LTPRNALFLFLSVALLAQTTTQETKKKTRKDQELVTQTLPLLKEPPSAASGETNRLIFHISPLTPKGLLTQQVRDALRFLFQENHGAPVVKLRAFVAGSGDLRRVQTLVSEAFIEHKQPIPVLTTILVGALPMDGAQVVIESIAVEKKLVNPNGLAFFSGQQGKDVGQSVRQLRSAIDSVGVSPSAVLRTTCFLSSLDDLAAAKSAIGTAFPTASANFVQLQRLGLEQLIECEAVGRLDKSPGSGVTMVNPPALAQNPTYSQIALVGSRKIVFTGMQMVFGDQEKDVRVAFDRLGKALESQSAGYKDVFWSGVYPTTKGIADKVRTIRFDYYDKSRPPSSTLLLFEGLPSLDASVAVEVAAVAN